MITHPTLSELVIDFVVAIVESDKSAKFPNTIKKLLPLVAQWLPLFQAAVAEGNTDLAAGVCRAAVAIGEGHITMLLAVTDAAERLNVQALLQLLVECTNHAGQYPSEESCSEMTNYFWRLFFDDLQEGGDGMTRVEEYKVRRLPPLFCARFGRPRGLN